MNFKTCLLLFFLLFVISCGESNHSAALTEAETAFESDDYERSGMLCEHILSDTAKTPLTCSELCRLSVLFMELSEVTADSPEMYVSKASEAYRRAMTKNADSVEIFFRDIPLSGLDKSQILMNISTINPADDSILTDNDIFPDTLL